VGYGVATPRDGVNWETHSIAAVRPKAYLLQYGCCKVYEYAIVPVILPIFTFFLAFLSFYHYLYVLIVGFVIFCNAFKFNKEFCKYALKSIFIWLCIKVNIQCMPTSKYPK